MRILLLICLLFTTNSAIGAQDYSDRFINSFSACIPHMETSNIKDAQGNNISITKIIQGVVQHNCVYKQVVIRPTVRDITVCSFPKQTAQEIVKTMKEDNGEKFDVDFNLNGQTIPLKNLTKSQIIWTQMLNSEDICKRQIIER